MVVKGHPEALHAARELWRSVGIHGQEQVRLAEACVKLWQVARRLEVRAAEINPLVLTSAGTAMALDCRLTVDDAAVFRHPELGIEVARELDHAPTPLERIAWEVERMGEGDA